MKKFEKIEKDLSNEIADSGFPTETAAKTVPNIFAVTRFFGKFHRSKKLQKRIDQALAETPFIDRLLIFKIPM